MDSLCGDLRNPHILVIHRTLCGQFLLGTICVYFEIKNSK